MILGICGTQDYFDSPYSPDFNPIEQKWGHVKSAVKKIRDKFQNFNECLESVLIGV